MKKGLLVGYMECSVLQVRGVSQTQEVVRDTHRSREARTGGAKWILLHPFKCKAFPISTPFPPSASPLYPLFSPGPRPAFPLSGSTGPTTIVWLPLCLRHFWKHDSWKKKKMRTATKSLEPYHLCSCSEKTPPRGIHTAAPGQGLGPSVPHKGAGPCW